MITSHDAVAEAAVFAVSVPGEVDDIIKACLVLTPGASVEPKEIADFFAAQLPYYASPRLVEIIDELPRNDSWRVMKFQLRERGAIGKVWDLEQMQLTVARDQRRA